MTEAEPDNGIEQDIEAEARDREALAALFGDDIVEQASLLDCAALNLNDEITRAIGDGVRKLKQLRNNLSAQQAYINELAPGSQLLLCMWVMDMKLLGSISGK